MKLVADTQTYRGKSADRQLEIDECLRRNLNHPGISKVGQFKEAYASPLPQPSVLLQAVESDDRITDAEWLHCVKYQGSGIGLLLNYEKTSERLYGRARYVHPSLAPAEGTELGFTLWTRSEQRPAGLLVNQQRSSRGCTGCAMAKLGRPSSFCINISSPGRTWVQEAVGSTNLEGDLHPSAGEDSM
jgi:hypothetical protein